MKLLPGTRLVLVSGELGAMRIREGDIRRTSHGPFGLCNKVQAMMQLS